MTPIPSIPPEPPLNQLFPTTRPVTWMGDWSNLRPYYRDQMVFHQGYVWHCLRKTTQEPSLSAGDWLRLFASGGGVSSVALSLPAIFTVTGSPVTGSGILSATLANQNPNLFLGGPGSGSAATPSFRSLVEADLPNLSAGKIASGVFTAARLGSGTANSTTFLRGDGTWAAPPAGSSGVTSVGLSLPGIFSVSGSPVTNSGTLSAALISQSANQVLAAPNGSSGIPGFRTLVEVDIPSLPASKITSGVLGTARLGTGTADSSVFLRGDGTWAAPSSGGTVTSVGLSLPSFFSVSGSPVTTSGTLSATLTSQSANAVLAAPNGSTGTPSFRALVAADIPSLDAGKITSGTIGTARLGSGTASSSTFLRGDGTWAVPPGGGSGTVTSVGLSLPSGIFTVSGSPVTTSGTLTGSFANQTANLVFASPPSGVASTPSFRNLVEADIPSLDASKIGSGTLAIARIPTGASASHVCIGNDSRLSDARTPTGTAGGDLSGTYPNPTVARLQGRDVASTAPGDGQVLVWSTANSRWQPGSSGGLNLRTYSASNSSSFSVGSGNPNANVVSITITPQSTTSAFYCVGRFRGMSTNSSFSGSFMIALSDGTLIAEPMTWDQLSAGAGSNGNRVVFQGFWMPGSTSSITICLRIERSAGSITFGGSPFNTISERCLLMVTEMW